jgi:hypothetical protein
MGVQGMLVVAMFREPYSATQVSIAANPKLEEISQGSFYGSLNLMH